jgi:hypothetical protein
MVVVPEKKVGVLRQSRAAMTRGQVKMAAAR